MIVAEAVTLGGLHPTKLSCTVFDEEGLPSNLRVPNVYDVDDDLLPVRFVAGTEVI